MEESRLTVTYTGLYGSVVSLTGERLSSSSPVHSSLSSVTERVKNRAVKINTLIGLTITIFQCILTHWLNGGHCGSNTQPLHICYLHSM